MPKEYLGDLGFESQGSWSLGIVESRRGTVLGDEGVDLWIQVDGAPIGMIGKLVGPLSWTNDLARVECRGVVVGDAGVIIPTIGNDRYDFGDWIASPFDLRKDLPDVIGN